MTYSQRLDSSLRHPATVWYQGAESNLIAELIQKLGLGCYIDLGCFHGGIARGVLNQVRYFDSYVEALLVDAIPEHLEKAREILASVPDIVFRLAAVASTGCSRDRRIKRPSYSPSGAGFAENCELPGDLIDTPVVWIDEILNGSHFPMANTYLKIDIEGEDLAVVESLLTSNFHPRVLHFEVLDIEYYNVHTLGILQQHGYLVVPLPFGKHRYYSVVTSGIPLLLHLIAFEKFEIYDGYLIDDITRELNGTIDLVPRNIMSTIPWRDPRSKDRTLKLS